MNIRRLSQATSAELQSLTAILIDCVEGGASVSFMQPISYEKALSFWQRVADGAARGERILLIAENRDRMLGTVQVILDQPENQPHRGDVSKMLVHRQARRRGVGEALMRAAEAEARLDGKFLLVLDTADAGAERLYRRCGWLPVGTIPKYALLPQGGYCDTTYLYKMLA